MKANTASRTAQYMALFRALEHRRPAGKRLFNDPYAISFLDKQLKLACILSSLPFAHGIIAGIIQRKLPGALASGIARTKCIDDLLSKTIQHGVRQVIILGAGFDTRALRLPFLKQIPVIEIDHPNTAALKTATLHNLPPQLLSHIRYLQIDFNTQSLEDLLRDHQIDFHLPTTIIWEGVTNYLTQAAVDHTFSLLERFVHGSYVIFTYVHKQVLDTPASFFGATKLLQDLQDIEERWTFGFEPEELPAYLNGYNYHLLEDMGAKDYREKYVPERASLLKGYEFYRLAFAKKKSLMI
jgi:methyltransferase (TIGR00027 family)